MMRNAALLLIVANIIQLIVYRNCYIYVIVVIISMIMFCMGETIDGRNIERA